LHDQFITCLAAADADAIMSVSHTFLLVLLPVYILRVALFDLLTCIFLTAFVIPAVELSCSLYSVDCASIFPA